jgi:hypothetical protein
MFLSLQTPDMNQMKHLDPDQVLEISLQEVFVKGAEQNLRIPDE